MANREAQLNLRLTAQDEARGVLREFVAEVKSSLETLRTLMNESINVNGLKGNIAAAANEAKSSLEAAATGAKAMADGMKAAGTAATEMGAKTAAAGREAAAAGEQIRAAFKDAELLLAGTMLEDVGKRMLGFFAESVHAAADFDQNIHNVIASLVAMGDHTMKPQQAFEALKQKALELGMTGFFSANEIGEAMNTMAQQGITSKQILGGAIEEVSAVAAANQQNLEHTANVMADIIHQMGDELKHEFGDNFKRQMEGVGDAMTKALHNGRMSMEDFLSTMRYAGPQAAAVGVSFKDLAGSIAELARHGIKGSQAGTTLRRMFTNLVPETKKAKKEFEELGFITKEGGNIFFDAAGKMKPMAEVQKILHDRISKLPPAMQQMAIKTIFGQYALSGMTAIIRESPSAFSALLHSMGETGVTAEALKEKSQGLGFQIQKLKAHFDTFKKEVGDALKPILISLLGVVNQLFEAWQKLPDGVKRAIVIFVAVSAAVATAAGGFMVFIATLRLFGSAMEPIIAGLRVLAGNAALGSFRLLGSVARGAVSGFRALGSAISWLIFGPWKLLINGLRAIPQLIMRIPALFARLGVAILNAFRAIPGVIAAVIRGITGFLAAILRLGPLILNAIRWILNWRNALMLIRGAFALVSGPWGALVLALVAGVSYVISHWNQIVKWVQQNFGKTIPTNFKQFQQLATQVWNQVQQVFTTVWNAIKKVVTDAWNYIKPTIMDGIKEVQKYWSQVWPEIQQLFSEVWTAMKAILGPSVAFFYVTISAALGFISGAWKDAWNAIKDVLKFVWDTMVGIIKTAWDVISGLFKVVLDVLTGHWSKAWNDMKNLVSNVWHDITGMFSNMVSDALSFGENFVKMIADGIMSGIHWVENAVSTVASKIKSFLGFHSPTEEGPASDSDRWMPNMMRMFADGITQNTPMVAEAATKTAGALKTALHGHHKTHHGNHHHGHHKHHGHSHHSHTHHGHKKHSQKHHSKQHHKSHKKKSSTVTVVGGVVIGSTSELNRYFQRLKDVIKEAIEEARVDLNGYTKYAGSNDGYVDNPATSPLEKHVLQPIRQHLKKMHLRHLVLENMPRIKPPGNPYGLDTVGGTIRNAYEMITGHTSHHPTVSDHDRTAGHSQHHPTVSYFDRTPGHSTKNVTVNIHVEGRSAKTDNHLAELVASKFREQIAMHIS